MFDFEHQSVDCRGVLPGLAAGCLASGRRRGANRFRIVYPIRRVTGSRSAAIRKVRRLAGVPIDRVRRLLLTARRAAAGLAGVVIAARVTNNEPIERRGLELGVIPACVLGGVPVSDRVSCRRAAPARAPTRPPQSLYYMGGRAAASCYRPSRSTVSVDSHVAHSTASRVALYRRAIEMIPNQSRPAALTYPRSRLTGTPNMRCFSVSRSKQISR